MYSNWKAAYSIADFRFKENFNLNYRLPSSLQCHFKAPTINIQRIRHGNKLCKKMYITVNVLLFTLKIHSFTCFQSVIIFVTNFRDNKTVLMSI
jgi:hypothetical protein